MADNSAKYMKYRSKDRFVFPSDKVNPKLKLDASYALAFMQAFMCEYVNNNCHVPFKYGEDEYSFDTLRLYATGKEGNSVVKRNYFGQQRMEKDGKYPTSVTVSFNGTDVMPKFFDIMRSINQKIEYKTTARAIDSESTLSKRYDKAYVKTLIDETTQDILGKIKYKPNSPINLEDIGAETESDVDLFFDSGGYRTKREIMSKACIQKTNKESDNKVIQDMQFDDIITLGCFAGKTYIDRGNNLVKKRYVDPARCLIPRSAMLDSRNFTRFAEKRKVTIAQIREEYPHISEAQIRLIAKHNFEMNPEIASAIDGIGIYSNEIMNTNLSSKIDNCEVEILDAQWLSEDLSYFLTNTNNPNFYKEVDYGYKVTGNRERTGDKVITKNYVKKYYGVWVIGTDIMLDYGLCDDIVYYGKDGNKIPRLDYFFYKTGNKSLVERCIQHIEDIHLAVVKLRNAIAKIPPAPRMIVQQQLMDNVFLNGKRQQPEDLYQNFVEKGLLVVNNLDEFNKPIFQNAKAIEFVPSGVLEDIQIFRSEIVSGVEAIREVTGANSAVDASSPNPYEGVGQTQQAAIAANNALSPSFNIFKHYVIKVDTDVVKKWQIVAKRVKDLDVDYAPLGIDTMQVLTLSEEFVNSDFSIYAELEYTQDELQMLLGRIIELSKTFATSQGNAGLSTAEFFHLQDMIMSGNFEMAKYVIARTEKRREQNTLRITREREERTFRGQQESAAIASKLKREDISYEERKKLLTTRVAEIEKRITKLTDLMTADDINPETNQNPEGVMLMISANQEMIRSLVEEDRMIDAQMNNAQQTA